MDAIYVEWGTRRRLTHEETRVEGADFLTFTAANGMTAAQNVLQYYNDSNDIPDWIISLAEEQTEPRFVAVHVTRFVAVHVTRSAGYSVIDRRTGRQVVRGIPTRRAARSVARQLATGGR